MTVHALAQAIKQQSVQPAQMLVGVGVATLIRSAGSGSAWVVRVSGLLQQPFDVRSDCFSRPFLADLVALGAGINGKRVVVQFINQQPIIAYALGDVISDTTQ